MTAQAPNQHPAGPGPGALRCGGGLLAVTAILTLALVMNHPVLEGRHGVQSVAVGIQALGRADRLVHGMLMAVLGLQAIGFYIFSARLGFRSPAAGVGLMAFVAGVIVMIIPTTLDGFVTPDLAAACLRLSGGCGAPDAGALRLVATMIQDFTKVALIATAVGTACWSLALLARPGWTGRIAGVLGLACAGLPAAILLFSDVYLQRGNLAQIMAAQVTWTLIAAGLMLGGERTLGPAT